MAFADGDDAAPVASPSCRRRTRSSQKRAKLPQPADTTEPTVTDAVTDAVIDAVTDPVTDAVRDAVSALEMTDMTEMTGTEQDVEASGKYREERPVRR